MAILKNLGEAGFKEGGNKEENEHAGCRVNEGSQTVFSKDSRGNPRVGDPTERLVRSTREQSISQERLEENRNRLGEKGKVGGLGPKERENRHHNRPTKKEVGGRK